MNTSGNQLQFVTLESTTGVIVQIPMIQYARLIASGATSFTLTMQVAPDAPKLTANWLTITDAARLLMADVDGLEIKSASMRVGRAADNDRFGNDGVGRERRIEPATFALWVQQQREHDFDDESDEDVVRKMLAAEREP